MIISILELVVTVLISLFFTSGIIALSLLVFFGKLQRYCQTVITLGEKDTDAELIIHACLRADRLLGRSMPPVIVDAGMTPETRKIVSQIGRKHELKIVFNPMYPFSDKDCQNNENDGAE